MLGLICSNGKNDGFEELGKQYDPLVLPVKNVPIVVKEIAWLVRQGCERVAILSANRRDSEELNYILGNLNAPACPCTTHHIYGHADLEQLSLAAADDPILMVNSCFLAEDTAEILPKFTTDTAISNTQHQNVAIFFTSWQKFCQSVGEAQWQVDTSNLPHYAAKDLLVLYSLDDYLKSKQIKNSRAMNSVLLAEDYVIKTSSDKKKMVSEYNWFQNLPPELQQHTPKMLACDFFSSADTASYTMERLKIVDLKSLFVFSNGTLSLWQKIFQKCFDLLDTLAKYRYVGKGDFMMANYHKTVDRVNNLPAYLHTNPAVIQKFLDAFLQVSQAIDAQGQENIIHGDYYLGNIMYDVQRNEIKLIDPRGTLFGSRFYDIAKLCKAVLYQYDYVDNELYLHNQEAGRSMFFDRGKEGIRKVFSEQFLYARYSGQELYYINMVVASLYLSMIPIHYHNHTNQQLFYNIFEEIFAKICVDFKGLVQS